MQFPLMFDAPRSSVQELDLAPEFLLQELTAFLPKPGKPARELPAAPLPDTFSEMSLHGSQEQCLQLLAPILRQLSDKDDARWLTLVTPPSLLSNAWLRSTHLNPERVLLLQTPSAALRGVAQGAEPYGDQLAARPERCGQAAVGTCRGPGQQPESERQIRLGSRRRDGV